MPSPPTSRFYNLPERKSASECFSWVPCNTGRWNEHFLWENSLPGHTFLSHFLRFNVSESCHHGWKAWGQLSVISSAEMCEALQLGTLSACYFISCRLTRKPVVLTGEYVEGFDVSRWVWHRRQGSKVPLQHLLTEMTLCYVLLVNWKTLHVRYETQKCCFLWTVTMIMSSTGFVDEIERVC